LRLIRSRKEALEQFEAALAHRFDGHPTVDVAPRFLGEHLVARGLLTVEQLDEALLTQTSEEHIRRLGDVLVGLGFLTHQEIVEVVAEQHGLSTIALARVQLDEDITHLLTEDIARELQAIPVRRDGERVEVAVADPTIEQLQTRLIDSVGAPVRLFLATSTDVEQAIAQSYLDRRAFTDALREFELRQDARKKTVESAQQQVAVDENAPVVKVVNLIFEQAVRDRASDVHIEPQEDRVRIRVRTDGALHEIMSLPHSMGTPLVSRIKVMSDMNIVERRRPQDGQMEVEVDGRDLDVRVSTSATVFGSTTSSRRASSRTTRPSRARCIRKRSVAPTPPPNLRHSATPRVHN
jgi:type IV pilus assembly protein PilB